MQPNMPRWPQVLVMASGAILIAIGIMAVCVQGYFEITAPNTGQVQQQQQMSAQPTSFSVKTRFPGIELIIVGALLEIVGFVGAGPWKSSGKSE